MLKTVLLDVKRGVQHGPDACDMPVVHQASAACSPRVQAHIMSALLLSMLQQLDVSHMYSAPQSAHTCPCLCRQQRRRLHASAADGGSAFDRRGPAAAAAGAHDGAPRPQRPTASLFWLCCCLPHVISKASALCGYGHACRRPQARMRHPLNSLPQFKLASARCETGASSALVAKQ